MPVTTHRNLDVVPPDRDDRSTAPEYGQSPHPRLRTAGEDHAPDQT